MPAHNRPERKVILLAEDEEDYVLLIRKAFRQADIPTVLHVVDSGKELRMYLEGKAKYADREEYPLPDLLLVDIKLPGYSGLEVLSWVRAEPGLCRLRVIVLTSSDRIKDVNDAYRLGANSFLVKPYDFMDLVRLATLVEEFWLKASECPESRRSSKPEPNGDEATKSGKKL